MAAPIHVTQHTYGEMASLASAKLYDLADGWTEAAQRWVDSAADMAAIDAAASASGLQLAFRIDGVHAIWKVDLSHVQAVVSCVDTYDGFSLSAVAPSRDQARAAVDAFARLVPARSYDAAATVPVSFWTFDPMGGGSRYVRDLDRQPWDTVAANYPAAINDRLVDMCRWGDAPAMGRLLVFHGPPGTGKTRFVQTLASEWASWCNVHYVVDPDLMFREANYMTRVMLGGDDSERWRLIVVEDGDEFIDRNAKNRSGYGVSRLLNIADGLVGQGLRVMVLVSTNARGAKFTPAMVQTGRCAAQIEFPAFTENEAAEWCALRGVDPPGGPATLAGLYAAAAGVPADGGDLDEELIG